MTMRLWPLAPRETIADSTTSPHPQVQTGPNAYALIGTVQPVGREPSCERDHDADTPRGRSSRRAYC